MSTVARFIHEGELYTHKLFCSEDDRVECLNESGNCVLTFTANCYVHTPDKKIYGKFSMRDSVWRFQRVSGIVAKISEHGSDLLQFETVISKMYLDGE